MKVLIVEELPERERLSYLLLSNFLKKKGCDVQITSIFNIPFSIRKYSPDIILENISDSNSHLKSMYLGCNYNGPIINIFWEQFINPLNSTRYFFTDAFANTRINKKILWGENINKFIKTTCPAYNSNHYKVCGSLKHHLSYRFRNIDKKDLRSIYNYPFENFEKTIVIAESFGLIEDLKIPEVIQHKKSPYMSPHIREVLYYCSYMKKAFIKLINDAAKKYPDYLFILRVHPSKNKDYYKRYDTLFNQNNVVINHTGDIAPLLRLSDGVIASRSGVLVDAALVNTPAVNITPKNNIFSEIGLLETFENKFGLKVGDEEFNIEALDSYFQLADKIDYSSSFDGWIDDYQYSVLDKIYQEIKESIGKTGKTKIIDFSDTIYWFKNRFKSYVNREKLLVDQSYEEIFELIK